MLLGSILEALGSIFEALDAFGLHLGTLGVHFRSFLTLWGRALDPFGHCLAKGSKKVPEVIEKGTQKGGFFHDFLSFSGKWQTAFGPSRLDRIGVRATRFRPLGLPFEPLVVASFFL